MKSLVGRISVALLLLGSISVSSADVSLHFISNSTSCNKLEFEAFLLENFSQRAPFNSSIGQELERLAGSSDVKVRERLRQLTANEEMLPESVRGGLVDIAKEQPGFDVLTADSGDLFKVRNWTISKVDANDVREARNRGYPRLQGRAVGDNTGQPGRAIEQELDSDDTFCKATYSSQSGS